MLVGCSWRASGRVEAVVLGFSSQNVRLSRRGPHVSTAATTSARPEALSPHLFTAVMRDVRPSNRRHISTAAMTDVQGSLQLLHRLPQDRLEL